MSGPVVPVARPEAPTVCQHCHQPIREATCGWVDFGGWRTCIESPSTFHEIAVPVVSGEVEDPEPPTDDMSMPPETDRERAGHLAALAEVGWLIDHSEGVVGLREDGGVTSWESVGLMYAPSLRSRTEPPAPSGVVEQPEPPTPAGRDDEAWPRSTCERCGVEIVEGGATGWWAVRDDGYAGSQFCSATEIPMHRHEPVLVQPVDDPRLRCEHCGAEIEHAGVINGTTAWRDQNTVIACPGWDGLHEPFLAEPVVVQPLDDPDDPPAYAPYTREWLPAQCKNCGDWTDAPVPLGLYVRVDAESSTPCQQVVDPEPAPVVPVGVEEREPATPKAKEPTSRPAPGPIDEATGSVTPEYQPAPSGVVEQPEPPTADDQLAQWLFEVREAERKAWETSNRIIGAPAPSGVVEQPEPPTPAIGDTATCESCSETVTWWGERWEHEDGSRYEDREGCVPPPEPVYVPRHARTTGDDQ